MGALRYVAPMARSRIIPGRSSSTLGTHEDPCTPRNVPFTLAGPRLWHRVVTLELRSSAQRRFHGYAMSRLVGILRLTR